MISGAPDLNRAPIGVFDSGIGGLTVVKEIVRVLPNESLIFIGDTARVPYGNRGVEVIAHFAEELSQFLLGKQVKYLVAACNTISSTCLDRINRELPVPVLGVVEPAIDEALRLTRSGRIGVIGTRATVNSGFYEARIKQDAPGAFVASQACPLFVPLAEEGMVSHKATRLITGEYLKPLTAQDIDVLILGCTHYPILREVIQEIMGPDVALVDSAAPTAEQLRLNLAAKGLLATESPPHYDFYVTDAPGRVNEVASSFFGADLPAKLRKTTLG